MSKNPYATPECVLMPAEYALKPCGVVDPEAKFPELVHYDCDACHAIVKQLLLDRRPQGPKPKKATQIKGSWMDK